MSGVDIPDDWDGTSEICICIKWRDSPKWIGVLQGLLTAGTCGRFWKREEGKSIVDAQAAVAELWEYNMQYLPCGSNPPLIYDPDTGQWWADTDLDGIPDELFNPDPANQGGAEDIPTAGGGGYACIVATGVMLHFEHVRDEFCDLLDAGADALAVAGAIAAAIGLLVPGAAVAAAFIEIAAVIAELNSTIIQEQMDQDFLDAVQCVIFDNLSNDLEVTAEEWQACLDALAEEFEGLQESIAWSMLNAMGSVGMQNAPSLYQVEEATCDCFECPVFWPYTGKGYVWDGDSWEFIPVPLDYRSVDVKWGTTPWAQIRFWASDQTGPCPDNENVSVYFEAAAIESGDFELRFVNVEGEEYFALSTGALVGKKVHIFQFDGEGEITATIRAEAKQVVNTPEWTPIQSTKQILTNNLAYWLRSDSFWSRQRIPDDGSNRHLIGIQSPWWKLNAQANSSEYLFEMTVWDAYVEGGGDCDASYWDAGGEHETSILSLIGQTITCWKFYAAGSEGRPHVLASFEWP